MIHAFSSAATPARLLSARQLPSARLFLCFGSNTPGRAGTHTHTRDVHTVAHGTSTQSQTANPTTIPTHSNTQTHNELTTDSTHVPQTHGDQTTHRRRSRTTRCQSAATDQGEAAPDSKEAALSEPNPAPSRSHTEHYIIYMYITEHLLTCLQPTSARRRSTATAVRRADVRYHHWLDLESAFAYRTDIVDPDVTCAHVTLTVWDR